MKRYGVIVLGLALLLAQPVSGQNLADPLTDGSLVEYQFLGTPFAKIGPLEVALPNGGVTSPMVNVYCVDERRYTYQGDMIGALVTNLETGAFSQGLSPLYYQGTVAELQTNLKMAAWLSTKFWNPAYASDWKDIHYGIWSLTSGRGIGGNYRAQFWVQQAAANFGSYNGGDYSDWSLLTTVGRNGELVADGAYQTQSVLVQTTMTHSPEPQTYLLMATGLIFLVFVGRRRLRENGYF